ncbi:cytochrome P450 [Hymenopellis radicata]|nr:cytochrome P450 [Hymenopellis radicata]
MAALDLISIFLTVVLTILVHLYLQYIRMIRLPGMKDVQGFVTILRNNNPLSTVFKESTSLVLGQHQLALLKHNLYGDSGWNVSANISVWPWGRISLIVADPDVCKDLTTDTSRFQKPLEQYEPVTFFGPNILAAEGLLWKRYKKICAPAFSERNMKMVWDESLRTMNEFFDHIWSDDKDDGISVDNFRQQALQVTIRVIASAGFGMRLSWSDHSSVPAGHRLTMEETFEIVARDSFYKMIFPDWLGIVIPPLKRANLAFNELRTYLEEIIQKRRSDRSANDANDLFSNLLEANMCEVENDGTGRLDDSELISNVYVFLLAGHETSSNSFAFAMALLALYPDEQEKLYRDILTVSGGTHGEMVFENRTLYRRTLAVFYETLRLFPPNINIPKHAIVDTTIRARNRDGRTLAVYLPKGSTIIMHPPGMHYDCKSSFLVTDRGLIVLNTAKYWKDPYNFVPDRFLEPDWPRHAFLPFSLGTQLIPQLQWIADGVIGSRSCIGRRFVETSMTAMINAMVMRYKITVLDEDRYKSESFLERRERVTNGVYGITHTPRRVPLKLTRRL